MTSGYNARNPTRYRSENTQILTTAANAAYQRMKSGEVKFRMVLTMT